MMAHRFTTILVFLAVALVVTEALQSVAPSTGRRTGTPLKNNAGTSTTPIPFAVTKVDKAGQDDMQDVSEMCVEVFFNEDNSSNLLKQMQLAYLRNLQVSYGAVLLYNIYYNITRNCITQCMLTLLCNFYL